MKTPHAEINETHLRLQSARVSAGFETAKDAADTFGWSYSTYASHENGVRGIKADMARKYGEAFNVSWSWILTGEVGQIDKPVSGVPVIGDVAAGLWLEADQDQIDGARSEYIPAVPDPRFPAEHQVAFRVRGNSMNKVVQDGAFAIGIIYREANRRVQDGDIVAVRRSRAGMMETTLKRYRRVDGRKELHPESDDPRFQSPVVMSSDEDDVLVEIVALIVGVYRPLL